MRKFIFAFLLVMAFALPVQAAELVTINDVSKDDVYNRLLEDGMRRGLTIQESNANSLTFRFDKTDIKFAINWGSNAYIQHVFSIAQIKTNVLVSYEMRVVDGNKVNPLSKESNSYYFPGNKEDAERGLLSTILYLTDLKAHFNGMYHYGFIDKKKKEKNYVEITSIADDGPSQKAGLKVGDKVVKINSVDVKSISYTDFDIIARSASLSGKELIISVKRGDQILALTITPTFVSTDKLKVLNP